MDATQERRAYPDTSAILASIADLKESFRRDVVELKAAISESSDKHQKLHLDFVRHDAEVKKSIDVLDKSQTEIWEELRKTQKELGIARKAIDDHMTISNTASNTKKGVGETVKYFIALVVGNGLLFAVLKLTEVKGP